MKKFFLKCNRYAVRLAAVLIAAFLGLAYNAGCRQAPEEVLTALQTGEASQAAAVPEETGDLSESQEFYSHNESGSFQEETVCENIYVYVCGQVSRPGVYALKSGSRIYEAVEAAGGLLDGAEQTYVNMAQKLEDQMQVYVPSKEEVLSGTIPLPQNSGGKAGETEVLKVNINTASLEELDALPGIGASKAGDIVAYRKTHGNFSSIEDLMNIPGIKSGIFDKIKDFVTVN